MDCPWLREDVRLWFLGFRFGEALHPGPPLGRDVVTFAVVNPTTILDKEWQIQQVQADVLLASETSANARVQKIMSYKLRGKGFRCIWGEPSATRYHAGSGTAMLRSYAVGVAAMSRLPCRPAVQPLPAEMQASCRITECFVRIQAMEVKCITIYGVPRCLPDAAAKNNLLLAWAYQRASVSCVPAIVGGDWNTDPCKLPAWSAFASRGWVELGHFAQACHGLFLPPTCKQATRFDTFLLPPVLLQYYKGADVLTDAHLFDSHAPMRLHLCPPGSSSPRWMWPLPRPYTTVLDAKDLAPSAYASVAGPVLPAFSPQVPEVQCGDKLRLWSATVEDAVHVAIREEHCANGQRQTFRGLPRSHRGRCRAIDRRQCCPPRLPRPARHGDPEPFAEVTSVRARQRLRQLRRITTFAQGLRKHLRGNFRGPSGPDGWPVSLKSEWLAIQRAAGYGTAFPSWLLQFPCFSHFPTERPALDFVQDLCSFVRYDVEALSRQAAKVRAQSFRYQLQVDAKDFSGSQCFVRVRPPQKPPFTCLQVRTDQLAQVQHQHSYQVWSLHVRDISKYDLHCQVLYSGVPAQVVQLSAGSVQLLFVLDEDMVRPLRGPLVRDRRDCSWRAVVGGLMAYWSPIWNRDSQVEEADIEEWPRYHQLLQTVLQTPPDLHLDLCDVSAWVHVARGLSVKKAVGVCGWHNSELKGLPPQALQDLAAIFASLPAFPADLMRARVAVLSKVFEPSSASEARPITILSGLYRLWARVLCSQVLSVWSRTMPPSITGCLKQRSAADLSFSLQSQVEAHLQDGDDFSGLCLDLRKAFNLLPRAPLGSSLCALGLPQRVCDFWLESLKGLQRHFSVISSLGPGLPSSTGAPEGDPVSVLGMLAVCWVFVRLLDGLVQPSAYMDNWSWSTDLPDCHGPALLVLQDLTDSLRVQIDGQDVHVGHRPGLPKLVAQHWPRFRAKGRASAHCLQCQRARLLLPIWAQTREKVVSSEGPGGAAAPSQAGRGSSGSAAEGPDCASRSVPLLVLRHGVPCPCLHHHQLLTWCSCTSCGWWPPHALRSCCTFRDPSCPGS